MNYVAIDSTQLGVSSVPKSGYSVYYYLSSVFRLAEPVKAYDWVLCPTSLPTLAISPSLTIFLGIKSTAMTIQLVFNSPQMIYMH